MPYAVSGSHAVPKFQAIRLINPFIPSKTILPCRSFQSGKPPWEVEFQVVQVGADFGLASQDHSLRPCLHQTRYHQEAEIV